MLALSAARVTCADVVGLIPAAMVRLGLSLFFFLLILSSFITALSVFFEAQDLRLYLGAPISSWQIYAARFLETVVNSSWMFLLFGIPIVLSFYTAFSLSGSFLRLS